jgi:hypothetical protein
MQMCTSSAIRPLHDPALFLSHQLATRRSQFPSDGPDDPLSSALREEHRGDTCSPIFVCAKLSQSFV